MELHQLRYFVAVADQGSFTKAAAKCDVAQPSLSQQVIKLEKELRHPLFERLGRTIRLTDAGRALYDHAVAVLARVDEIRDRVTAATDPKRGTVTIGAIPTIAPYLMPSLLKSFGKKFPQATLALHENLTDPTTRACLAGEIDVGIIASPSASDLLHSEPLFTESLLLALPPSHPLVKKRKVSLDELEREPFVLMSELHCLGDQIVGFCRQRGYSPVVRCQGVQLLTIQELVAQGHGVSLIPAMAHEMDRGRRCEYRELADPTPTRTIHAIWHKDRYQSPLVKEFIRALRDHAARQGN
ncbi:LysR family transcriptional regulator [Lacipirellula sp.]|uniref:LysR family transcriptional regulator n=1 Tax=Lacipirellula sp. TaxID=2691419 RepID=UPI003D124DAE